MAELVILHLYPRTLRLNGEAGNLLALEKRLQWLGHSVEIKEYELGQMLPRVKPDLIFIGSGTNTAAELVFGEVEKLRSTITNWVVTGTKILGVGVGFDLLATDFTTKSGTKFSGFGFATTHNLETKQYLVGEAKLSNGYAGFINTNRVVNHEDPSKSLGTVEASDNSDLIGYLDGFHEGNIWGSNLQGPLLPMNPKLADEIIGSLIGTFVATSEQGAVDDLASKARAAISKRIGN